MLIVLLRLPSSSKEDVPMLLTGRPWKQIFRYQQQLKCNIVTSCYKPIQGLSSIEVTQTICIKADTFMTYRTSFFRTDENLVWQIQLWSKYELLNLAFAMTQVKPTLHVYYFTRDTSAAAAAASLLLCLSSSKHLSSTSCK